MNALTVLYDPACPTCSRARRWLESRPQLVRLDFVAAGSAEARSAFPELDHARTLNEITAISDDGEVFVDGQAWVVCLWALRDYRRVSALMATPALNPLARKVITSVSKRVAAQRAWRLSQIEGQNTRCDC
ncbi:MAG: thiol-disulfide oxidoreductase DCC family protein [Acidothermaceae bacterium]